MMTRFTTAIWRHPTLLYAIGIGLIILCLYWPVLGSGSFVLDDQVYVFENPMLRKGLSVDSFLWALDSKRYYHWAPSMWISFLLDAQWWGTADAWGYHLGNILLHTSSSVLLFLVALELGLSQMLALALALSFGLHPISVEPAVWISSRKDCLAVCFSHLSLWLFLRGLRRNSWASTIGFLLACTLSLGAKVSACGIPLLAILLWILARTRAPGSENFVGIRALIFGALAIIPALFSVFLNGYAQRVDLIPGPEELIGWTERGQLAVEYFGRYLALMVWPPLVGFTYSKSLDLTTLGVASFLLFSLWGYFGWRQRKLSPAILVGIVWCFLFLLPYLRLFPVGNQYMANRWAYGAVPGFLLAIFGMLNLGISRARLSSKILLGSLLTVYFGLWGIRSISRWSTCLGVTVYDSEQNASNPEAWILRASCEMRSNIESAKQSYTQALQLNPSRFETVARIIKALPDQDALRILEPNYQTATPRSSAESFARGMSCREFLSLTDSKPLTSLLHEEAHTCAQRELLRAAEDSDYADLARYFAALVQINQNPEQAMKLLAALHKKLPLNTNIGSYLGLLKLRAGEIDEAKQLSEQAAQINQDNPLAWEVLAYVAISQNDAQNAVFFLERVLLLSTRRPDIHQHLADQLDALGAHERAKRHRDFANKLRG